MNCPSKVNDIGGKTTSVIASKWGNREFGTCWMEGMDSFRDKIRHPRSGCGVGVYSINVLKSLLIYSQ